MHRFNFRVPLCVVEVWYKEILYCYFEKYIGYTFIEPCILKYLLRAQQLADLLLDEALKPMKEGLGSYITTVSDGWMTVGPPSITMTQ